MRFKREKEEDPVLVITPLTDIFFLLLVFLMCTSNFHIASGVPIKLPKVAQKAYDKQQHSVLIAIDKSGGIYLKEEKMELKELGAKLKILLEKERIVNLIVQADEDVRHGRVIEVMDLAKVVGIPSITIAAQWDPKKGN